MREYYRRRPELKDIIHNRHKAFRKRRREMIDELRQQPCADCGKRYPVYVMEFDHARGPRNFALGSGSATLVSLDKLLSEIEKCDVVCANCHKVRTHKRRIGEF